MTTRIGANLLRAAAGAGFALLLLSLPGPTVFGQAATGSNTGSTTSAGAAPATSTATDGKTILNEGTKAFEQGDYTTALLKFRELTLHPDDPAFRPYQGDAYFWVAKSALALNRLDEAQRNLEYFLMNFPGHPAIPEASYLKGRLLFLQNDFQSAIQVFQDFIQKFSDSPFIANAYYWSGECLYALGQFDSARKLFEAVVQNYPTSYRVEAADYKLSLIDQKKREEELLKLLQWSHEEALKAQDEFQKKEKTYREAIAAYQQKLAGNPGDALAAEVARLGSQVKDLQSQVDTRDATIEQLKEQVAALTKQLASAQGSGASGTTGAPGKSSNTAAATPAAVPATTPAAAQTDEANRSALLDLKNQALDLKQSILQAMNAAGATPTNDAPSSSGDTQGTSTNPSGTGATSGAEK